MNIIINLNVKLSIPRCNRTGKEGFGFGRQIIISFNMILQRAKKPKKISKNTVRKPILEKNKDV